MGAAIPSRSWGILAACIVAGCTPTSPNGSGPTVPEGASPVDPQYVVGPAPAGWVDCVGVLQTRGMRGLAVSNAKRFGAANPALRTSARIGDLSGTDLGDFCDFEACITANGYAHVCAVGDAGWERCRVCDGGPDCGSAPTSQADCVAHASDRGRASCHAGLLQECYLQRALRGPLNPLVTESCALSAAACAGQLPGDLSEQATNAESETTQVTIEVADEELEASAALEPDAAALPYWQQVLASLNDASADAIASDATGVQDAGVLE